MNKLLSALIAAAFAVVTVTPAALAAEKKADPMAAACKGKKAGDEVTVDGKKMKCPAMKK
jgi:hypothetical protein